jgi:GNAT superfamily N-acetyltransferase
VIGTDFGGRHQARLGELVDALGSQGLVAEIDGERCGLVTFAERAEGVEIVYIEATERQRGVGTRLLDEVVKRAGAQRMWLVTTNDNLEALRFYQRRGFRLAELHRGAVDEARRRLKPTIPEVGSFGIPIRDELVLELLPSQDEAPDASG